jgi:hypothetical protein
MKKYFLVLIIFAAAMLWGQNTVEQFGFSTSVQVKENSGSGISNEETVEEIIEYLNELQYSYLKKLPKSDYKESVKILNDIKHLIGAKVRPEKVNTSVAIQDEQTQSVNINMNFGSFGEEPAPAVEPAAIPVVQPVINKAMDAASFSRLMNQIEDEGFADDQMRYIRTASSKHYFSVSQVGQLIDLFSFSEEKIDCLRVTYPKVVDKDNGFNLIGKFTYADEKEDAEQIINQY